ncbi:MAG: outer membrane protein transport protein [Acidobacteria bacterium]|nr:outer membrane protein transport protein [Acidobacteriota bacterium]
MYFRRSLLTTLVLVAFATSAAASGFSFFEQGAKASALGGAFVATADDPSAIWYNVAGLAYQRSLAASMGATFVTFNATEFRGDPASPYPGGDVRETFNDHVFIVPNLYAVVPIGENATFAIGQFMPLALRSDWADPNRYSGRFISQDANIKSLSIQPSFAMKMADDRFAFGVGVEYRSVHISLEQNLGQFNPFTGRIADIAYARLNSDWNSGIGWNAGLMYRPNPDWSIGLQHRAAMDIDFEGDAKFTQISTGNAQLDAIIATQLPPNQAMETNVEFPSVTSFGIATTKIPNWRVELDVVQTGWAVFDELRINFLETPQNNVVRPQNWDDSLSYRIGGSRPVTSRWEVRLGAVYDETPQPIASMGPLLPDADRYGVSFGLGYRRGPWTVDLSEFALFFEKRGTDGQNLDDYNGTYETNGNLVSFNVGYTF